MTNTETPASKCLRCGRSIRSAVSVKAGYGPVCRARIRAAALAEIVKGFTAAQVEKARELIEMGGLVPAGRPGVFRAVSSRGDTAYLTHSSACNCPGGLRGRGACYHSLAVRIVTFTRKAA